MKLMSKMNCGIIYAVKWNKQNDLYKNIASFMSNYTATPIEYYTPAILENILVNAISDLLDHMEHPSVFWHEYWRYKQFPWEMTDFEAMCAVLNTISVKDDETYINGFRPMEENDF